MANLFPELFHCSGFAIYGDATRDGRLYHGRILDYFRGQGLEQNAVVIVSQPDEGHAWVNISYAGFVGSVTAMNERHVAMNCRVQNFVAYATKFCRFRESFELQSWTRIGP